MGEVGMKERKERLQYSLWVSLLVSVTFCVFGPLEMIMSSASEFWFSVTDVLLIIILGAALVFCLLFGLSLLVSHKSFLIYPLMLGLGLALYIQGNFTFVSYGVMDGRTIDWSSFGNWPIINTLLWLLLMALPVALYCWKKEWFCKVAVFLSAIIVAIQLVTLGMIAFTTDWDSKAWSEDAYLSVKGIDEVSPNGNVVIFVMDTFDDEYFKEILAEDPAFLEPLDGFTYFSNSTGMYPTTKGAMPFILSGQKYRNEQPYIEYINDAYYKTNYYKDLNSANYEVSIYGKMMFVDSDGVLKYISNVEDGGMVISSGTGLLSTIYKATAFRYFPHIAKKTVWYYSGDFDAWKTASLESGHDYYTTQNLDLYRAIGTGNLHIADTKEKYYKFYYCYGVHPPYKLRADMTETTDGTVTYKDAAKGCLNMAYEYIEQLKALGVYDQATIVITADHGKTSSNAISNPILLVKPRGESGALVVSDSPVSQEDLFATVMTDIGLNEDHKYGRSAFEYTEGEQRSRSFLSYTWDDNWDADYLPSITEYAIPPETNDPAKFVLWDYKVEAYCIGEELSFTSRKPTALPYLVSGFGPAESNGTWTYGNTARLGFKVSEPVESDLIVTMECININSGKQDLKVYLGEYELLNTTVTTAGTISFRLPARLIQNSEIELDFLLPDADSPLSRGESSDERILALFFSSMSIDYYEAHPYEVDEIYSFAAESPEALAYCTAGFSSAETKGTWTSGNTAHLEFKVDAPRTSDLMVTLDCAYVYAGKQDLTVYLEDYELLHTTVIGDEEISFRVPAQLIQNGNVFLKFELPDADSPLNRGESEDARMLGLYFTSMTVNYAEGEPLVIVLPTEPLESMPEETTTVETIPEETVPVVVEEEPSFNITDIVAIPLIAMMGFCHSILDNYILTILVFTLLTKIILLPVSLWVHKSGITMVKITPELNRVKIKHYGDRDAIDDATQALYKREKYNPIASTVPMIVQIVMLLGVIGAVKNLLTGADSALTLVPSEAGGATYLMPVAAGVAALALGLAQNKLSPLQREQGKKEQWMSNGFSIAISLFLGAFVSLGVGVYWIASNLLSIAQQLLLNVLIKPEKHIDYVALEESKKELASLDSLSAEVSKEDRKREQDDYKKFFSVANKHLVIYSEKSGFYKYYKDVMDFMLKYSNVIIHYVTNDPKDQVFKLAEEQPRIRPYYISEKKLITLLMKMDADIVVMTCPDLDRFHLKRSYVRKDIEYVYMFHYPLSTHMVLNNGALDHYDTILCVGDFQFEEIRAAEKLYNLPEKKLISAGYGQLEQLYASYQKMEKVKRDKPKILIAPSWQMDNILDSCIDPLLDQLLGKGYELVIRPHPEYVKRYKPRMDAIVQKYSHHSDLTFELDFTSNNSLFDSDVLISDWSGSAYEFSLVTLKPAVFINTPPKINNPEYDKLNVEPLEFKLRGEVGIQIDPNNMENLAEKINALVGSSETYAEKIQKIRDKYIANFGRSGEVGGKYILGQLLDRQKK